MVVFLASKGKHLFDSKKGLLFEEWVAEIYDHLGMLGVKHNVILAQKTKKGIVKSQFDITFRNPVKKYYVECKYHENNALVPFKDLAVFTAKLSLIGVKPSRGIIVTNTYFEERALLYAKKTGLKTIGGDDLLRMYHRAQGFFSRFKNNDVSLDDLIKDYFRKKY